MCIHTYIEVVVGLQRVLYSVQEGGSLMLCVELVGQTERNVEVMLSTLSNGSTEGMYICIHWLYSSSDIYSLCTLPAAHSAAGMDYLTVSEVLIFEPGVLEQCADFSALSDALVENEEIVSVLLSNVNPQNVTLGPNQATIVITDATGIPINCICLAFLN